MAAPADAWAVRRPAPALQHVVDHYIGYRLVGGAPGVHRGLPSVHMTFIVGIGPPIDVIAQTDPSQAPRAYRSVLSGLQATPALIAHAGHQEGVAIGLRPGGSRTLFGMPARALWDLSVELDEVAGAAARELWERLQQPASWPERFAACDQVLGRLLRADAADARLAHAWDHLVRADGPVAVADVAARAGWSRQHLTRRFRDEFGIGPQLAARIARFSRAGRMLRGADRPESIAGVAAACGYADQAHLNRDVAAFAGCTPVALMDDITGPPPGAPEQDVPSVQDAAAVGR